jgi:sulfur relay (sulfurtransferase) complex TusBCD TusD component (DsrE family)
VNWQTYEDKSSLNKGNQSPVKKTLLQKRQYPTKIFFFAQGVKNVSITEQPGKCQATLKFRAMLHFNFFKGNNHQNIT